MYWKRLFTVHIEKALAKELSIHTELKAYQDVFEMVKDALEISDVKVWARAVVCERETAYSCDMWNKNNSKVLKAWE